VERILGLRGYTGGDLNGPCVVEGHAPTCV
jgi:hypothetical protein